MPKPFNFDITARDKTGEALKRVSSNFEKLAKSTPLEQVGKKFAAFTEKGRALAGLSRSLSDLGVRAGIASGGLGEAAGGLGAIASGAGVAAAATIGLVGAVGVAAAAATKWQLQFSKSGAATERFSDLLGISTYKLQQYELAGEKAGVSSAAMAESLHGLSNALEAAGAGRNEPALRLLNQLHVRLHRLPNGAVDATRAMDDLARAMQANNPQAREVIANTFGMGGALYFLIQKQDVRERQLAEAAASGAIRSKAQLDADVAMTQKVTGLDQAWHRLLNTFSTKLIIPWLQPTLEGLTRLVGMIHGDAASIAGVAGPAAGIGAAMVFDAAGRANPGGAASAAAGRATGSAARAVASAGRANRGASTMTAGRARAFFLANGYSPEAASGIAAGIVAEGGHAGAQNPTSSAYGAGQWLKSHWADFHRVIGRDIHGSSVNDQLRFMLWELSHSENPAGSRIRRARTSSDALNAYVRGYMRPRGGTAGDLQRGSVALAQGGDHKVHVDIRLAGAPSGTAVKVASSHPAVSAGVKVTPTLAGASV